MSISEVKMLKHKIIIPGLFFLLFFATEAYAQMGALNFQLAFPQNEFYENVKRTGFGVGGEILWQPHNGVPYAVGLDASFLIYGQERRRAPWSWTIPDVTVDVERTNSIMKLHLLFKITPSQGTIRPYIDLLFGGEYLSTETKIEGRYSGNEVVSDVNFDDWAWSYGGGAGIMIQVSSSDNNKIFIDLKARYIFGSEAEYLKEGSVAVNPANGSVTYFISKSKTDLLTVSLGATAFFRAF